MSAVTGDLIRISNNEVAWNFNKAESIRFKTAAQGEVFTSDAFKVDGIEFYLDCTPNGINSWGLAPIGKVVLWLGIIGFNANDTNKLGEKRIKVFVECEEINLKMSRLANELGRMSYAGPAGEEIDAARFAELDSWSFHVKITFNYDRFYASLVSTLWHEIDIDSAKEKNTTDPIQIMNTLKTTKYSDNVLVTGYIRIQTHKYNFEISSDLLLLFYKWYHADFGWNPNECSPELEIDADKIMTTQADESMIFHSAFMSPCIGNTGLHQFCFRFKGELAEKRTEFAIGIIDNKYQRSYIGGTGVGDCEHSAAFYIANQTAVWHHGSTLMEEDEILSDDSLFMMEIQNFGMDKCVMSIFNLVYEDGKFTITIPIHAHKLGVSFRINDDKYPIGLELVNYNVNVGIGHDDDEYDPYDINEGEFGKFIEHNMSEETFMILLEQLNIEWTGNDEGIDQNIITAEQIIDVMVFLGVLFIKYNEKRSNRPDSDIDNERLKKSLMGGYEWILENKLKENKVIQQKDCEILGKWLKQYFNTKK